jgi:hypothetical protein
MTEELSEEGAARMGSIPHFLEMNSRPTLRVGADFDDQMSWNLIL